MSKFSKISDLANAVSRAADAIADAAEDASRGDAQETFKVVTDKMKIQVGKVGLTLGGSPTEPSAAATLEQGPIDMTCKKCGGTMEISDDGLHIECPYCGDKQARAGVDVNKAVRERERTKREAMRIEADRQKREEAREEQKRNDKQAAIMGIVCLVLLGVLWIGASCNSCMSSFSDKSDSAPVAAVTEDPTDEEGVEDEGSVIEEFDEDEAESEEGVEEEAAPVEVESIEATYYGSTKSGTKVSSKSDFSVLATYSDGSVDYVDGWKVAKSMKVKSGETIKVKIKYEGKTCTVKIEGDVPREWENAVMKAQNYSDNLYMSKAAIYKQLTSKYGEGFGKKAAKYAMKHVSADWKYNALQKARVYYEQMGMSKSAVYNQLVSNYGEEFTAKQARYAIKHLD